LRHNSSAEVVVFCHENRNLAVFEPFPRQPKSALQVVYAVTRTLFDWTLALFGTDSAETESKLRLQQAMSEQKPQLFKPAWCRVHAATKRKRNDWYEKYKSPPQGRLHIS
jgi:hypothetical protein